MLRRRISRIRGTDYHVSYDPLVDALDIRFSRDEIDYSDMLEGRDLIIIDYNERGEIVGIEILSASRYKIDLVKLAMYGHRYLIRWLRRYMRA